MHRLAIYDMDKTITRRATWIPFLAAYAGRNIVPLLGSLGPLALYAAKQIDRARLKEMTQRLIMGNAPVAAVEAAADRFAGQIVAHEVYDQALARIEADKAAGYRVVLATASYDFYVRAIAARLGIGDVVATPSTIEDGLVLSKIAGENCYGPAKLRMIEAWMKRAGIARADAHIRFYSDHVSDAPTLAWADEAFAVNPHGPLRARAQAEHWSVLDWR